MSWRRQSSSTASQGTYETSDAFTTFFSLFIDDMQNEKCGWENQGFTSTVYLHTYARLAQSPQSLRSRLPTSCTHCRNRFKCPYLSILLLTADIPQASSMFSSFPALCTPVFFETSCTCSYIAFNCFSASVPLLFLLAA